MSEKPQKPYPDFPLFPHATGQWAKKIKGRMVYFGTDWKAALKKYHTVMDGPPDSLKAAIDKYLVALDRLRQSGEVTLRHYKSMEWTLGKLSAKIGPTKTIARLTSDDYGQWRAAIGATNGAVSLGNHVRRVRAFLNWCVREKIIKELPAGDALKKPSRAQVRKARVEGGSKMFSPDELRQLIKCAGPQLRAMIYLALNAGLGPEDLAQLRTHHLQGSWLVYPRTKTWIERRVPLWPETYAALAAVIREGDDVVFRTKYGNPWTPKGKMGGDSPISAKFRALCKGVGIHKKGRGFYSLRHVCATIGQESGDYAASEAILGHVPDADDMGAVYRERMSDARLNRVSDFIREWVLSEPQKTDKGAALAPLVNVESQGLEPEFLEVFGPLDRV
jgi:integrase